MFVDSLQNTCPVIVVMRQICETCAKVCEACAKEYEKHDMDHCKQCSQVCYECAKVWKYVDVHKNVKEWLVLYNRRKSTEIFLFL